MKKLRVTLEGKSYEVTVEYLDESTAAAPARPVPPVAAPAPVPAVFQAPAAPKAAAGSGEIRSPLAGKLVSIDVKLGQTVAEGAQVATIEAMKMNTYVFASKAGPVTAIVAASGQAVEEGAPLLVIG